MEPETREEWRVVDGEGIPQSRGYESKSYAEDFRDVAAPPYARLQRREVTPWTDVEEEGDE